MRLCAKHKTDTSGFNPAQMQLWLRLPCLCVDEPANPAAKAYRRRHKMKHILVPEETRDRLQAVKDALAADGRPMTWAALLDAACERMAADVGCGL